MQNDSLRRLRTGNFIQDYLEEHFDGRMSGNGQEFVMPSLFVEDDYKRHMSVNVDSGLWQCFKSKKTGNFIELYAHNEGISKRAAYSRIIFKKIERGEIWDDERDIVPEGVAAGSFDTSSFEPITPHSNVKDPVVAQALSVLYRRGLFPEVEGEYYIAREGPYNGRLIFPYKDELGEIYFFQARALSEEDYPKYLNPGREEGVKSSDILYPFSYDTDEFEYLYVTEGPTDAKSLQRFGLNATCTNGSNVSAAQAHQLKESGMKIVIAYDADSPGIKGRNKFFRDRKFHQIDELYYVEPPSLDWNALWSKKLLMNHMVVPTKWDPFQQLKDKVSRL